MGGGGGLGGLIGGILGDNGPSAGGVGGTNDLARGLQSYGNELWSSVDPKERSAFGSQLAAQAMGKAPSIAEAQLKMAMDRNLSQQIAASKANRAVNPALQARMVNQAAQQGTQQVAQQGAINKLAEQQQAQ